MRDIQLESLLNLTLLSVEHSAADRRSVFSNIGLNQSTFHSLFLEILNSLFELLNDVLLLDCQRTFNHVLDLLAQVSVLDHVTLDVSLLVLSQLANFRFDQVFELLILLLIHLVHLVDGTFPLTATVALFVIRVHNEEVVALTNVSIA